MDCRITYKGMDLGRTAAYEPLRASRPSSGPRLSAEPAGTWDMRLEGARRARGGHALTKALPAVLLVFFALALVLVFSGSGMAAESVRPETLELVTGRSLVRDLPRQAKRVSLADPEVAEIMLISPTQVYLSGKKPGATNITIWDRAEEVMGVFELTVSPDSTSLKRMLHKVLPGESGIMVLPAGGSVTLSGTVSSNENLATALSLAEAYAPGKVVNLMRVGGVHQVMIEVKVAEMLRSTMKKLGFNFGYQRQGSAAFDMLDSLTSFDDVGEMILSSGVNLAAAYASGGFAMQAYVQALKENGLIKILAEPNLVCMSGQSANFLAGGEIPVPVPQGLGTVAIEWKPFGVGLTFTPVVLGSGKISLKVQPEVSELDESIGVKIDEFQIPGITTRRASTMVELKSGQSFAIAGLIKDSLRTTVDKYPALGDIPVLGTLFRSSEFQKSKSELIIIVTPHLAKPLDMAGQTLPTDGYKEPDDFDFYLMGRLEAPDGGAEVADTGADVPVPAGGGVGGFDGEYGHAPPK